MRILAIETSCDETGICIIDAEGDLGAKFSYVIRGNTLLSQTETHAPYGGVFPNLARREHEKNLVPLMKEALQEAEMLREGAADTGGVDQILTRETELLTQLMEFLTSYEKPEIDAIAVTHGPGLEPALWVGVNFAKALAHAWQLPLVPVNHMEGHIVLSAMEEGHLAKFKFPLLALLISGGHTELVLSKEWLEYQLMGQTRDDAVGEAFDKVARLLDLPYPGGPEISRLATEAREQGLPRTIELPRPMIDTDDYDFSFSGLKTAVRRVVESHRPLTENLKKEIAREFEDAAAEVLIAKTMRAIEEFDVQAILVGGGVSANEHIRTQLASSIKDYGLGTRLLIPPPNLATDNALMIALAGYFRAIRKEFIDPEALRAEGNLKLGS
jgi:N6-L-threonylcarbamoyladenine synthase